MARETSSVPTKRALRPRQEVDYTRKVVGNGGTNTPSWCKANTSKAKQTLRCKAARQSLSKRGKSLPAASDANPKQRGGQNQPPSPASDGSTQELDSDDSLSNRLVSTTNSVDPALHVLTKNGPAKVSKPSHQQDCKARVLKRQAVFPHDINKKRPKRRSAEPAAKTVESQPAQTKAAQRGKLQKLSQANNSHGRAMTSCLSLMLKICRSKAPHESLLR